MPGIGKYHDKKGLYIGVDKPTLETILHKKHGTPNILGNLVHCRYYRQEIENNVLTVDCQKQGKRESCKGCYICPHCTGKLFLDVAVIKDFPHSYVQYNKVCLACTLHVFGDMEIIKKRETKKKAKQETTPPCAVEGCKHKAWEGYKFVSYYICHSHRRKHRTWLRLFNSGVKDETERPLLIAEGKLVDNPKYNRKVKNAEQ